jgi:hypothetical protein
MRYSTRTTILFGTGVALAALAACSTPQDAARADSAAGGSPTAKLDSTSNPATIDGDSAAARQQAAPKTP